MALRFIASASPFWAFSAPARLFSFASAARYSFFTPCTTLPISPSSFAWVSRIADRIFTMSG